MFYYLRKYIYYRLLLRCDVWIQVESPHQDFSHIAFLHPDLFLRLGAVLEIIHVGVIIANIYLLSKTTLNIIHIY